MNDLFSWISLGVCAAIALINLSFMHLRGAKAMLGLNLSMALWQAGKILASQWSALIELGQWLSLCGAAWIPFFFVLLARHSSGQFRRPVVMRICSLIPTLFCLLQIQHWIVSHSIQVSWGLSHQPGPAYGMFMLYYAVFFSWGLYDLLPQAWWSHPFLRSQQWAIGLAALSGILLGSVDFANTLWGWQSSLPNLAPLLFSLVLGWSMYRFELVEKASLLKKVLVYFWAFLGSFIVLSLGNTVWKFFSVGEIPLWLMAALVPLVLALWNLFLHRANPVGRIDAEEWEIYQAWLGRMRQSRTLVEGLIDLAQNRGYQKVGALFKHEGRLEHLGSPMPMEIHQAWEALSQQKSILHLRALYHSLRFGQEGNQAKQHWMKSLDFLKQWDCDIWLPLVYQGQILGVIWMSDAPFLWKQFSREIQTLEVTTASASARLAFFAAVEEIHAQKRLAEIGFLTAALAHQVKNPLEGILGGLEVWREIQDPQMLEIVEKEALKLSERVQLFLQWTKDIEIHTQTIELESWLTQVLPKDWELFASFPCQIQADPSSLEQIFEILVHNAQRHAPGGGYALYLNTKADSIEFDFADRGPGVSKPEDLFQPFKTSHAKGHGLGLALAQKLARAHGGDLFYSPRDGGGSIFKLNLAQRNT